MGEVWVAKQTALVKRKVALKLIKAGVDSKAVLTRFEQNGKPWPLWIIRISPVCSMAD